MVAKRWPNDQVWESHSCPRAAMATSDHVLHQMVVAQQQGQQMQQRQQFVQYVAQQTQETPNPNTNPTEEVY